MTAPIVIKMGTCISSPGTPRERTHTKHRFSISEQKFYDEGTLLICWNCHRYFELRTVSG